MKLGIDSYSYHRYFGEVYAGVQKEPSKKMDLEERKDEEAGNKIISQVQHVSSAHQYP